MTTCEAAIKAWEEESKETIDSNKNLKKVGRNEKCPCGSGKKFKHCHGSL